MVEKCKCRKDKLIRRGQGVWQNVRMHTTNVPHTGKPASLTSLGPAEIGRRLYRYDRVHTPLSDPEAVGPEAMREYWTKGYIAVNNVFTPDEVKAGIDALLHLIEGRNPDFLGVRLEEGLPEGVDPASIRPEDREPYVRKLMHFVDYHPHLKAMSRHPKLLAICQRLIGSGVQLAQDMALLKPPRLGREKPWHQDNAYFNWLPLDGVIGTWTALDPATLENGCMHVIPGSHLLGPQPHYHDRDCQLADDMIDVEQDVCVPLEPGGVLFFHGLLFHGTPPNQSSARRRAVQYHYASVECRRMTDAEHMDLFKDGAGYAGCRSGWSLNAPPRRIADRVF